MDILFSPLQIRNKTAANRFTAQAMEGNDADSGGIPSDRTIERYKKLAAGGWGIVVVEAISAVETSLARINGLFINRKNIDGFKKLVDAFRKENKEGLLFFQITHSGGQSGKFSDRTSITQGNEGYRFLSSDEIEKIKESFVEACLLANEAGADGVDFKMCHGYLGGEILRPKNTRQDKWGGSFENRIRFLKEGICEIKARLKDKNFILGSRISFYEGIKGGCGTAAADDITEDLTEMLEILRIMDSLDMDYINVSAGIPAITGAVTRPTEPSKELAYHHLRYAKIAKKMIESEGRKLKVIGSAYSSYKDKAPEMMAEMLSKNYTDFCGFGRQTFADPLLPKKLLSGGKINWCILCSGCSKLMARQINDGCIIYNDYYRELN